MPNLPALLATLLCALPAAAGSVLDHVRATRVLHCAAAVRPGLAFPGADGAWHGLEVDICRAVAVAAAGPGAQIAFGAATLQPRSYDAIRSGEVELSFLTASEMLAAGLLPNVLPGPPVFYATSGVMVPDAVPARRLADLQGRRVCAEPGTGPERSLNAWFASRRIPIHFFMFQESDEMLDAFGAGRCEAVAHETTSLAALRLQSAADGHPARILPEPLAAVPVLAVTPRADADWAAVVSWTVATLLRSETLGAEGPGGGREPLPLAGAALGLAPGWQDAVLGAVGSYGDIHRRNLGAGSPLDLSRGLNALWPDGLFCPPFSE